MPNFHCISLSSLISEGNETVKRLFLPNRLNICVIDIQADVVAMNFEVIQRTKRMVVFNTKDMKKSRKGLG